MEPDREQVRVRTAARLALRAVPDRDLEAARARLLSAPSRAPSGRARPGEPGPMIRPPVPLGLAQRLARALERLDRRLEDRFRARRVVEPLSPQGSEPVEMTLWAGGLSCALHPPVDPGSVVEVAIDLLDEGSPTIRALARVDRCMSGGDTTFTAIRFIEIGPVDLDRLNRFLHRAGRTLEERSAEGPG